MPPWWTSATRQTTYVCTWLIASFPLLIRCLLPYLEARLLFIHNMASISMYFSLFSTFSYGKVLEKAQKSIFPWLWWICSWFHVVPSHSTIHHCISPSLIPFHSTAQILCSEREWYRVVGDDHRWSSMITGKSTQTDCFFIFLSRESLRILQSFRNYCACLHQWEQI